MPFFKLLSAQENHQKNSASAAVLENTHKQVSHPESKETPNKDEKKNPQLSYKGKWSKHGQYIYFTKDKRAGWPLQNIIEYLWTSHWILNTMGRFGNPWIETALFPRSANYFIATGKAYWALSHMVHYHFQTPMGSRSVTEGLSSISTFLSLKTFS